MPAAAPAVENGAGPPKSELEELQIKANQVTDDVSYILQYISIIFSTKSLNSRLQSLESTRRMLALCEEVSSCHK